MGPTAMADTDSAVGRYGPVNLLVLQPTPFCNLEIGRAHV